MKPRTLLILIILFGYFQVFLKAQDEEENSGQEEKVDFSSKYAGEINVPDKSFHFGYVPRNSRAAHIFKIKNDGPDTLEIIRVKPGCSCTRAPIKKRLLSGGDSTEVEIIFKPGIRTGQFKLSPKIYTSDKSTPETALELTGTIFIEKDSTQIHPLNLDPFGLTIPLGQETAEHVIKISNNSGERFGLRLIAVPEEYFSVELPGGILAPQAEGKIKILLRNSEALKKTGFKKSFTFELSDKAQTRFTVPVIYGADSAD